MAAEHEDDNKRIGLWMMLGAWVLVIGLATILIDRYLERSRNPNNQIVSSVTDGKRGIVLQRSRHGHYLVSGAINGADAVFLVDTGATSVSVPVDLARAAGLVRGAPIKLHTANGVRTGYMTRINRLRLGDLEMANVTAHINPGLSGDVLLGMSVLKHFELVQRGDQLIIRQP